MSPLLRPCGPAPVITTTGIAANGARGRRQAPLPFPLDEATSDREESALLRNRGSVRCPAVQPKPPSRATRTGTVRSSWDRPTCPGTITTNTSMCLSAAGAGAVTARTAPISGSACARIAAVAGPVWTIGNRWPNAARIDPPLTRLAGSTANSPPSTWDHGRTASRPAGRKSMTTPDNWREGSRKNPAATADQNVHRHECLRVGAERRGKDGAA